ncbi:hypothetical protein VTN49DRAFT_2907 [Thermomyces lanuginosus]|uniref:uncharacterized protein n=1 Tax=Thermomyces lanuginosus TaxID=5541 RepID=UPI003741FD68
MEPERKAWLDNLMLTGSLRSKTRNLSEGTTIVGRLAHTSGQQLCPLSLNNAILIPYPGSLLLRYLSALKQSSSSFEDIE